MVYLSLKLKIIAVLKLQKKKKEKKNLKIINKIRRTSLWGNASTKRHNSFTERTISLQIEKFISIKALLILESLFIHFKMENSPIQVKLSLKQ